MQRLIDAANPTGYSQVLEVRTAGDEAGLATAAPDTYLIGLDVTGQWRHGDRKR